MRPVKNWNAIAKIAGVFVVFALSATFGPQIDFSSGMRGPGGFAVRWVNYLIIKLGLRPSLGLTLTLIGSVDTLVCFSIFLGGYWLLVRLRGHGAGENLEVKK
jgi:hypothetical protein